MQSGPPSPEHPEQPVAPRPECFPRPLLLLGPAVVLLPLPLQQLPYPLPRHRRRPRGRRRRLVLVRLSSMVRRFTPPHFNTVAGFERWRLGRVVLGNKGKRLNFTVHYQIRTAGLVTIGGPNGWVNCQFLVRRVTSAASTASCRLCDPTLRANNLRRSYSTQTAENAQADMNLPRQI